MSAGTTRAPPAVDVSVVICTFNRCAMLSDTLESWREVARDDVGVELIVVDNASTDATRQVVEAFAEQSHTPVRYVREPWPGLSRARNRGIRDARGGLIAFVDDDVYFDPGWLRSVYRAFRADPGVHCIGGRSLPAFEVAEPEWLSDRTLKYYGSTQSGDRCRTMVFPEHPYGVNMAFRREVFETLGGFRTDLGRKGTSLLSDEEKELFYRVDGAGMNVLYLPDAIIHHRVTAERVEPGWLLRRAYWQGISSVVFDKHIRRHSRLWLMRNVYRSVRSLAKHVRKQHGDLDTRMQRRRLLGVIRQSAVELLRPPSLRRKAEGSS